eukprot:6189153-Pleurochrysis_carterae.AAC.1
MAQATNGVCTFQARLADLESAAAANADSVNHAKLLEERRELSLLRDSHAMMRAREEERAASARAAHDEAKAMREQ